MSRDIATKKQTESQLKEMVSQCLQTDRLRKLQGSRRLLPSPEWKLPLPAGSGWGVHWSFHRGTEADGSAKEADGERP